MQGLLCDSLLGTVRIAGLGTTCTKEGQEGECSGAQIGIAMPWSDVRYSDIYLGRENLSIAKRLTYYYSHYCYYCDYYYYDSSQAAGVSCSSRACLRGSGPVENGNVGVSSEPTEIIGVICIFIYTGCKYIYIYMYKYMYGFYI